MNALEWPKVVQQVAVPNFYKLVWQQVCKDFRLEAIEIGLSADENPLSLDEIYRLLYPKVKQLIEQHFTLVSQLLYRMAISEERISNQLDLSPNDSAHAITYTMVCREAEKVLWRTQLSKDF